MLALIWWGRVGIGREDNCITSTFKAGQVVQGDGDLLVCNLDCPAILPVPLCSFGAEDGSKGHTVDEQLEPARRCRRFPRGHPVARANPYAVLAGGWKPHLRCGVFDRLTQTVSQQQWRAHLVGKLLVDDPAAEVVESLGFNKDSLCLGCRNTRKQQSHK